MRKLTILAVLAVTVINAQAFDDGPATTRRLPSCGISDEKWEEAMLHRGSTCALGLEEICFGSVMACGAGRVWAAAMASVITVLISMTIANEVKVRMESNLDNIWIKCRSNAR